MGITHSIFFSLRFATNASPTLTHSCSHHDQPTVENFQENNCIIHQSSFILHISTKLKTISTAARPFHNAQLTPRRGALGTIFPQAQRSHPEQSIHKHSPSEDLQAFDPPIESQSRSNHLITIMKKTHEPMESPNRRARSVKHKRNAKKHARLCNKVHTRKNSAV